MLRGVVHDPTARRMGGVAGHAGLFSTAADLAIFCRMLLAGGVYHGARVLSPLAVEKMTSPTIGDDPNVRGLGWDIDSSYSSNRGELLPVGSFGHTGFTGTSLWIDPATDMFVVFLSNRVHPDGKGDVTPLRARVATVAASAILAAPPARGISHMDGKGLWSFRPEADGAAARTGHDGPRRPASARLRVTAGQARGPHHEPHRAREGRLSRDRFAARRQERQARGALRSRARHSRCARLDRACRNRRQDRPADPLPLWREPPAYGSDARRHRHARDRPPGHRCAVLHLHDDDGLCHGGGRQAEDSDRGAGSAESDRRVPDRRAPCWTRRS